MIAILLTIIISYIIASFAGHVIHWALHQTWSGFLNKAHMSHHLEMYPIQNFTSDVYRHAGNNSTPKYFALAALPVILAPIILGILGILPLHLVLIVLFIEGLMGFLNDHVHDSFHLNHHWMMRVPGLKLLHIKWTLLHYIHHKDMTKNFGIFTFSWDKIFGTFEGP